MQKWKFKKRALVYLIREIYYFEKRWPFKIAKFKADEIFLLQIRKI